MTALYIIGVIFFVFFIVLAVPVTVKASYNGKDGRVNVKYLFIEIYDYSGEQGEKKTKKVTSRPRGDKSGEIKKEPKNQKGSLSQMVGDKGIWGTAEFFKFIFKTLLKLTGSLIKRIRITRLFAEVKVCGEDAGETAVNYGKVCGVFYPACGLILEKLRYNKKNITAVVYPDFNSDKSAVDIQAEFKTPLFWVALHGLKAAAEFFVNQVKTSVEENS